MKRLTVFGAIFGCGLLLLVLLLGPARLFRAVESTEIGTSDIGDVPTTVRIDDPGRGGRPVGLAPQGAGQLPHWVDRQLAPGVLERLKEWEFSYTAIEAFPGGFHFTSPRIELFPARRTDERPTTVIEARGSDIAMRGSAAASLDFSDKLRVEDVKAFTLAPAAVIRTFTAEGVPEFTLTTDRLEAPETPLDAEGRAELAATLIAPGEVRVVHADGSFDLRGGGMELQRLAGRIELRPPLSITTTGLALPGARGKVDGAVAGGAKPARDSAPRLPITITADGPATYLRAPEPKGVAAPAARTDVADASAVGGVMDGLFGPGELLFTGRVALAQGDRTLTTDRLRLKLVRAADGTLAIEQMEAGVASVPLQIGLLAGRGSAAFARFRQDDGALEFDGPVQFDDLVIGEGEAARRVALAARQRVEVRELPADTVLPDRLLLVLHGAAHLEVASELVAEADSIELLLRAPRKSADGRELPAELIEAQLIATRPGGLARAELIGQGRAFARRIRLTEGAAGRVAVLTGEARAELVQGFVTAPDLELQVAAAKGGAITLLVPHLTAAEFDLPAGAAPFEPTLAAPSTPVSVKPARRLVIDPLAPCQLTRVGDRTEFAGRARYRVHELTDARTLAPTALQELTADLLRLATEEDTLSAEAGGDVLLTDTSRGLTVAAAHLRTARRGDAASPARWLLIDGAPAVVTLPLRAGAPAPLAIRAPRLEFDLGRGSLDAFGDDALTQLAVPAAALQQFLGAPDDASADTWRDGAVEVSCTDFHFAPEPVSGALDRGTLRFEGGFVALRASDGASATAARARFDLARGEGRLDGADGAPVQLMRALPWAVERVERLVADWVQIEKSGARIRCADHAVAVVHPEDAPTAQKPLPDFRRIVLRTGDGPDLIGERLALTGGVEFDFEWESVDDQGALEQRRARAAGDRAVIDFERVLSPPAATATPTGPPPPPAFLPLRPRLLTLTQHVTFDFEGFHLAGATLVHRLLGGDDDLPPPGWFLLKKGVDRVALDGSPAEAPWQVALGTEYVLVKPPSSASPEFEVKFGPTSARLEARRGE